MTVIIIHMILRASIWLVIAGADSVNQFWVYGRGSLDSIVKTSRRQENNELRIPSISLMDPSLIQNLRLPLSSSKLLRPGSGTLLVGSGNGGL